MKRQMKVRGFRFPDKLWRKIIIEAKKLGFYPSQFVRRVVEEKLNEK